MLIPYEVDVPFERTPWVNWLLAASLVVMFGFQMVLTLQQQDIAHPNQNPFDGLVLREFNLAQMVGHMWLHGNIIHLAGNLIFLWVFGNAICQKIGNGMYFPVYLLLGLAAAVAGLLFTPHPERGAIGASGAINGIVGMYLVLYPCNDISMFYFYWWGRLNGTFEISGFWIILLWLGFDILGAVSGVGNTGYFAHLGGFFTGVVLAVVLLLTRRVVMDPKYEESLLDIITNIIRPKPESGPIRDPGFRDDDVLAPYRLQKPREKQRSISGRDLSRPSGVQTQRIPAGDIVSDRSTEEDAPLQLRSDEPLLPQFKLVRYACSCGKRFKSPVALAGRVGICPQCKKQLVIPDGPVR